MQINILLPHKEKFTKNKMSSVSITVKNNLNFTIFKKDLKIFGQYVEEPIYPENFVGIKNPSFFFQSKNKNIAKEMCKILNKKFPHQKHLIEVHNRPYLIDIINQRIKNKLITIFFHNDPQQMKGSKSIRERDKILSVVNKVFCVSEFVKNKFLDGIEDFDNKVEVLYNGVPRNIKKIPNKQKEIIFVGKIIKEKGPHLFVDAVKKIYPNLIDWNFSIIGSKKLGENKNKNIFVRKICKDFSQIGSRTRLTGFLSQMELDKIFKEASIIVIPSIWEEPFGLIAAEAMANGVAIISSNLGGLKEIIDKNGIILTDINSENIAEAIMYLTNNENILKKYQTLSWENFMFSADRSARLLDDHRKSLFKLVN